MTMKKEESQLHLDTQYKLGEINQSLKNVVKTLNEYHEEMLEYVKERKALVDAYEKRMRNVEDFQTSLKSQTALIGGGAGFAAMIAWEWLKGKIKL